MTMYASINRFMLATVTATVMTFAALPVQAQQTPAPEQAESRGFPDLLSRWFPQFFGAEEVGPRPEDTLQAPFSDREALQREQATAADLERRGVIFRSTDGQKYRVFKNEGASAYALPAYDGGAGEQIEGGSLAVSHRRPEHLSEWLTNATSEILTTDSRNYAQHMKHLATGMSEGALVEYQKFMTDTKILEQLSTQPVKMAGYVEEAPLLLNEGDLNGRYRWLFEMPVTVTLLPANARNYKEIARPEDSTLRFIVQTQVGRVEKGPSSDNVFIETWRVRPAPAAKKGR